MTARGEHGQGKTTPQAIERAERRARAVQLRADGHTIRQVAQELGISPTTAHEDIQRALAEVPAESVDQLRAIWGQRLESAVSLVMDQIVNEKDVDAVPQLVALTNRAARLWGLDSPTQVSMVGATDIDLDQALRDYRDALIGPVEPVELDSFTREDEGQDS